MKECRLSTEGEEFLRQWYGEIDGKKPFSEISGKTVGRDLIVDFPGNPLDFSGFRNGMNLNVLITQENMRFIL